MKKSMKHGVKMKFGKNDAKTAGLNHDEGGEGGSRQHFGKKSKRHAGRHSRH